MALITQTLVEYGPEGKQASVSYTYDDVLLTVISVDVSNPGNYPIFVEFRHKTKPGSTLNFTVERGQLVDAKMVLPPDRYKMGMIYDEWLEQDVLGCIDLDGIATRWPA